MREFRNNSKFVSFNPSIIPRINESDETKRRLLVGKAQGDAPLTFVQRETDLGGAGPQQKVGRWLEEMLGVRYWAARLSACPTGT